MIDEGIHLRPGDDKQRLTKVDTGPYVSFSVVVFGLLLFVNGLELSLDRTSFGVESDTQMGMVEMAMVIFSVFLWVMIIQVGGPKEDACRPEVSSGDQKCRPCSAAPVAISRTSCSARTSESCSRPRFVHGGRSRARTQGRWIRPSDRARGHALVSPSPSSQLLRAWNKALGSAAREGDPQRADKLFAELERASVVPDILSYNTMVYACAVKGDIERALPWLFRMRARGIEPDTTSYNILIDACVRARNPAGAEAWFQRMRLGGLRPNQLTYSMLIQAGGGNGWRAASSDDVIRVA